MARGTNFELCRGTMINDKECITTADVRTTVNMFGNTGPGHDGVRYKNIYELGMTTLGNLPINLMLVFVRERSGRNGCTSI